MLEKFKLCTVSGRGAAFKTGPTCAAPLALKLTGTAATGSTAAVAAAAMRHAMEAKTTKVDSKVDEWEQVAKHGGSVFLQTKVRRL